MTILDVAKVLQNVHYIMIHKEDGTKSMSFDEIFEDEDRHLEIKLMEFDQFIGHNCIVFTVE